MSVKRLERVNELIKQEVASALFRVMNEKDFDLAAVSVTRVVTASDLRTARVMVSIRNHKPGRDHMLKQLQHHHGAIQALIRSHIILKYTPVLHFELDETIEEGDRILRILSELEKENPAPPPVESPDKPDES